MSARGAELYTQSDDHETAESSSAGDFLRELARPPRVEPPGAGGDRAGAVLGRFQLLEPLGRGGMGVVYTALDRTLRRKVALKLLSPHALGSEERQLRFLREARAAAAIDHPNIAAVFEAGEAEGEIFLAIELVDGLPLRAHLKKLKGAPLPVSTAVRIAIEIARGLAAAHRAGVIHRDVKPENVMIGRDGRVKILDFGLAKLRGATNPSDALTASHESTRVGRILGSPGYMAPEQARGLPVDARADIFSLGVVLFEMLAGERPFGGPTAADQMASLLRDEPPPLRNVPAGLAAVVARCLAKDPALRYPDADALLQALTPAPTPAAPRPARRQWQPFLWLALLLTTLAVGATSLRLWGPSIPPAPAPAYAPAPAPTSTAPAPSPAPSPGPTAITDLPLPSSPSAEAIAAYKDALQSFRDADWVGAESSLKEATRLDPTLAAAHLRLALILSLSDWLFFFNGSVFEAHDAYHEAARRRDTLSPRDRDLFEAIEPAMRLGSLDLAETVRGLERLTERYPLDAELWHLLALYHSFSLPERQLEAAQRAVELDPKYADAWQTIGTAHADKGPEHEIGYYLRCLTIMPTASDCWGALAQAESRLGRCEEATAAWRRRKANAPEHALQFANLLYASGKPREAVFLELEQKWALQEPGARKDGDKLYDHAQFAAAYGDFPKAMELASKGLQRHEADGALAARARFSLLLADIELETGRDRMAAAFASDFLKRRDALRRLGGPVAASDPTVYMTRVAARGGALSEAEMRARRDAWYQAESRGTPLEKARAWWLAYALGIQHKDEAVEALAARPEGAPGARHYFWSDESIGQVLWLADRHDEAFIYLERVTQRCDQFARVMSATRTNLLFGQALEERGDTERACATYRSIADRWGDAKPRSVTAEAAKKRAKALGCRAPTGSPTLP